MAFHRYVCVISFTNSFKTETGGDGDHAWKKDQVHILPLSVALGSWWKLYKLRSCFWHPKCCPICWSPLPVIETFPIASPGPRYPPTFAHQVFPRLGASDTTSGYRFRDSLCCWGHTSFWGFTAQVGGTQHWVRAKRLVTSGLITFSNCAIS